MDNESRKWLYKNLRMNGYNVGNTQEEFDKLMDTNEESRKWAYDRAQELGYNVGKDYNEFTSLVGPEKPAQKEQAAAQAGEAPRQDAAKPTWQQSMAYQMQAGDIARSTQQSMQDFNTRMENIRKGNTLGKTSDYSFNPESGKMEQRYYTTQGDEVTTPAEQSRLNLRYRDEWEATTEEGRKHREERMQNDYEGAVNAALAKFDPDNAALQVWQQAEDRTRAEMDKHNAEITDRYAGFGGREMRMSQTFETVQSNMADRLKQHDLQKMADEAWNMLGTERQQAITDDIAAALKNRYPQAADEQIQQAAKEMAREQSDRRMYAVAIEKNAPKSATEYFLRKAIGGNALMKINEAFARKQAGTTGDWEAREIAEQQYEKQGHKVAGIAGTVTGFALDPLTWASAGVGGSAVKGSMWLGGKLFGQTATRKFGETLVGRMIAGAIGGGANFATFEAGGEALDQTKWGSYIDEETGERKEGFSWGNVGRRAGHGALMGSITGTIAPFLGNVSDRLVKATESTAGKLAVRTGELGVGTLAEGTIFAVPELVQKAEEYNNYIDSLSDENSPNYIADEQQRAAKIEELRNQRGEAMQDVWTDNMAMIAGFKAQHLLKSAPARIAEFQRLGKGKAGFETRIRMMLDGTRPELALTDDEKKELEGKYDDLKELTEEYKRYAEAKEEYDKAHPNTTDAGRMIGSDAEPDIPYNRFTELMNDGSISEAARAKMYYYLTGNVLPMSTVMFSDVKENKDAEGNIKGYTVQSIGANGVITSRTFDSKKRAEVEVNRINRQAELNGFDVGERSYDNRGDQRRMYEACQTVAEEVGAPANLLFELMKEKTETMDEVELQWVEKIVRAYEGLGDKYGSSEVRAEVNEKYGVDVDKAIGKERNRRSDKEQAAVEEYGKLLFADAKQKQEEAAGRGEAPVDPNAPTTGSQAAALLGLDEEAPGESTESAAFKRGQKADTQERQDIAIELAETGSQEAQDAWNGVVQRINEDAEYMAAQNRERNKELRHADGSLRPAVLKEKDSEGNDQLVYIVDGNVQMTPDGSMVDKAASDNIVVVYNPATGERKQIDPTSDTGITYLGISSSPEQQEANIERRKQEYIQEMIDEAQGTVRFAPGQQLILPTGEEAVVVAVSGNGEDVTVALADGTQTTVQRSELQRIRDEKARADYRQRHNIADEPQAQQPEAAQAQPQPQQPAANVVSGAPAEYAEGMEITIRDDEDGVEKPAMVMGLVRYENGQFVPDANGGIVEYLMDGEVRHDHLDKIGEKVVNYVVPGQPEPAAEAPAAPVAENGPTTEPQRNENGVTAEAQQPAAPAAEVQPQPAEVQPAAAAEPAEAATDAMPMVGTGEDAEPDFMATTPQRGHKYIYDEAGLSREEANQFVANNIEAANKALDKVKGKAPKMGTSIAKYNKDKAAWQQQVSEAQNAVDYWNGVKAEQDRIALQEREAQRERDAAAHDAAVLAEQQRQAEELARQQEQAERGANAVHPAIRDKWEAAPKIEGAENEITLANGERVKGRYVLVESGAATPSHNPNMEFAPSEGFPVDENGQTVNDRDYERDKDAQDITRSMGASYDSRAIQEIPIVSNDGVVLSGNGRTMAGELAAQNNTDGAYIEHLQKYPQQFGFTSEQVQGMQHPRVLFVPDEAMPYTTETFAKFNQQGMKSQSRTEQSVKLGKTVDDATFGRIIQSINAFDSLNDFYNDPAAATNAIGELRNAGVINSMQYAEMFDGESVSGAGRQMLENMLIGKAFEGNPDAIRQLSAYPAMRQSVISALAEISNNLKLGEDYSVGEELASAIDLAYKARKGGMKSGEPVSVFARQLNLFPFEEGETVADYTNATVLMLADRLNGSKTNDLKHLMSLYNHAAGDAASGQLDVFEGGVKTKDDIIKDALNVFDYGTKEERKAAIDAAREGRKVAAAEQGGGSQGVQQNGANDVGEPGDGRRTDSGHLAERQGDLGKTEVTAPLSDELNEFDKPFVLSSDNTTTFGEVTEDSGLKAAPIKLSLGENTVDENGVNHGYGLLHIEAGHGEQIRAAGFSSVQEFVETVAKNYDTIREGGIIADNQTYLLEISDDHNNTLFIQLSRDGSYWNINSAGIFKQRYSRRKPEVYTRPALEPGTNTDSSGVNSGQTEGVTAPAGNSPQTSDGDKWSVDGSTTISPANEKQPADTENISALDQSSEGKGTNNSANNQEKAEVSSPENENTGKVQSEVGKAAEPNAVQTELAAAEQETNTEPTEAQKEAGNYKKGHVKIDGYDVTIENPKGSERSGTDASGKKWSVTMNNTYGYIRGTEGVDGDHIDVFLSDDPSQGDVFVVDQVNEDGSFDEHKVMYGFPDIESARKAYLSNYEEGWQGLGAITPVSKEEFKKWINSSHRKTKPFAEYSSVKPLGDTQLGEQPTAGYTIEPTTYTNKKGKTTPMHLVTFGRELSKEELRAGKELARESRGWWDSKQGGFMMRDEESAKTLAEALGNEEAVQDAQPLSVEDVAAVNDHAEVKAVDESIKVEQGPASELNEKNRQTLEKFNAIQKRAQEIKSEAMQLIGEDGKALNEEAQDRLDALQEEYRNLTADLPKEDLIELKRQAWEMLRTAQGRFLDDMSNEKGNALNFWANIDSNINRALSGLYGDRRLYIGNNVVEPSEKKEEPKAEEPKETQQVASEPKDLFGNAEEPKPAEANKKQTGKIEDVGEHLKGARKDMRREIAKSLADITLQDLIEKPFGKVYKKPDIKKAVESGALRDKDAMFYEAFFSLVNLQKPKVTQRDVRNKKWNPSYKTNAEKWAESTFRSIEALRQFMEADEADRDFIIEKALEDRFPNREAALAEIEKRKGWNPDYEGHKYEWGDKTTPNPMWVTYEILNKLGWNAGDKVDIPFGVIRANTSGTGYCLYNLKDEYHTLFGRNMSLEQAIDAAVYLARLKRGDADVSHPTELFTFKPAKAEWGESGQYRVVQGYSGEGKTFDSKEEADAYAAKKKNAAVLPIREVKRQYDYRITFNNPLTGERMPVSDTGFDTREEAQSYFDDNFEKINDAVNNELQEERAKKGEKKDIKADDVVRVMMARGNNGWTYAVLIDKKYANNNGQYQIIKEGFANSKEAKAFADSIKEDVLKTILKHKEEGKKVVYFDTGEDSRIGEDYRGGKDVTGEDFMDAFGFRGVQFGNWTNSADRQMAVNQAYDAFMDLAKLIGVSPKALSLNGELGIAFGARGGGNAMAHYEGGDSVVINLTKTKGAGSLAHEWWHALDNYFARKEGRPRDMVTDNRNIAMRDELRKAFNDMLDLVNESDYAKRSVQKGDYWGRTHEVTARLLAEWVDQELKKRGELNTFLSRGANVERWQKFNYQKYEALELLSGREPMTFDEYKELPESLAGYPYPSAKEVEQFGDAMRNIFDTMQERVDEETGKTILYHRAGQAKEMTEEQRQTERALGELAAEITKQTGVKVHTDSKAGQELIDLANGGIREMGSRVKKRKADIAEKLKDKELAEEQKAVVSVFTGEDNNVPLTVTDKDGKERRVIMRQGKEQSAGAEHSIYRHYDTSEGYITAEDLLTIPEVIANGERTDTQRGNTELVKYVLTDENGTKYTVLTEINHSREELADFYTNRKASSSARRTHSEEARANNENAVSGANLQNISETDKENAEKIREHRVYHGSGADFDRFDHKFMGTGEGNQAFGWGTYVTEVEGIGRQYAESIGNGVTYKGKTLESNPYSDNPADRALFYIEQEHGADKAIKFLKELMKEEEDADTKREYQECIDVLRDKKSWGKSERLIYEVEIPDDNGRNYIDWKAPLTEENKEDIRAGLLKDNFFRGQEQMTYDDLKSRGLDVPDFEEWLGLRADVLTTSYNGEDFYRNLSQALGGNQIASEFLRDCGFTGIKYPTNAMSGGDGKGTHNYVIFNENDLKITDKRRFFRTSNGEAYGFVHNGEIYLDPKHMNPETPLHEYTHLWADVLRKKNPKEWENVKKLLDSVEGLKEEIQKTYPELEGDELYDEMLAKYSGREGAKKLAADAQRIAEAEGKTVEESVKAKSFIEKVKEALQRYWKGVCDWLNIHFTTAEEVADRILADWARGFNPVKDAEGNAETRLHKQSPVDDGILFSENIERTDPFYSNAAKAVTDIKQEKATGEQWLKMIEKNGGLKKEEDKWMGLSDWLKGKKSITKAELQKFIADNSVKIQEVNYQEHASDESIGKLEEYQKEFDDLMSQRGEGEAYEAMIEKYGEDFGAAFDLVNGKLIPTEDFFGNGISKEAAHFLSIGVENNKTINGTRLQYTTEGLENKREIALTVPTIEPYNAHDEIHFGDAGEGRAVAWIRFGETTDKDGSKVLVIDEIQSKRHQDGREQGYSNPENDARMKEYEKLIDEAAKARDAYHNELIAKYSGQIGEKPQIRNGANPLDIYEYNKHLEDAISEEEKNHYLELKSIVQRYRDERDVFMQEHKAGHFAVPDAPFQKTWHELALKRMLRYAAENGYDKIAWTTGEQQANRYNMSELVDEINTTRLLDGRYEVEGVKNGERVFGEYYTEDKLPEIVGKELANKIVSGEDNQSFKGDDLRIGGHGMEGFYDRMLPQFMDKYGKKWGVKTGEVELDLPNEADRVMHSVDVTPEMKESVMKGQPLFRKGDIRTNNKGGQQTSPAMKRRAAEQLGEKLHTDINIIEDVNSIEHPNKAIQERMRKSKGWYDTATGKVYVVLANNKDVDDVKATVGHETIAHKGLRELVGEENYGEFLDETYRHLRDDLKKGVDEAAGRAFVDDTTNNGERAKSYEEHRRTATDELFGRMAEKPFEEFSEGERTLWQRIKATVRRLLDKFLGTLKLPKWFEIGDNELRYMLWRSKERMERGKEDPIDVARDIVKREELKLDDAESTDLYRDGDETGDIWSDQSMSLQERMTAAAIRLANNHSDNKTLRNDAMRAIGGNLADLRRAMSLQRTFDMTTVKRVADLVRVLMDGGYLNGLSQQEVKRLLAAVKNSVGKNDIERDVQKVMDIMIDNQLKHAEDALESLESIKASKVDTKGVEVQGKLDPQGAHILKVFKKAKGWQKGDIEKAMNDAQDDMASSDAAIADEAALNYAGLQLAQEYVENIQASKTAESFLRDELKKAREDIGKEAYLQYVASLKEGIRQNKVERIESLVNLIGRLSGSLRESIENAKAFKEAEKQRIEEIHHFANSDMQGKDAGAHRTAKWKEGLTNGLADTLFNPLMTFEQFMRMFGSRTANGEGYLFNHFMRGAVDARDKEIKGVRSKFKVLDGKVSEIFGKDADSMGQLISYIGSLPHVEVKFFDDNNEVSRMLNQGNLMYIYMVNKMLDGKMKLRRMGISEEDVTDIENALDPRLIQLADWLQDEFLVKTRNEYNETHKRMFGASMSAIEHYFPLKILGDARIVNEELDKKDDIEGGASTTVTGAIIKRTPNATALDITNADALHVILDHIAEMEHWNAYAEWGRDLNTLLSYKKFRNRVKNMNTIYGSGDELWNNFKDCCRIAAGTYHPKTSKFDKGALSIARGVTAACVSFRLNTALKQLLSLPAVIPEVSVSGIIKYWRNPENPWKWSMENLPQVQERWLGRMSGDPRLMKTDMGWNDWRNNVVEKAARLGMSPNAFVDAVAVSIVARTVYDTRYEEYLRDGYSQDVADKKAKQDATMLFNLSQQSSEGAYLSPIQARKDWLSTMFTIFRNSPMSYTRQVVDSGRNLKRAMSKQERDIMLETMKKKYMRDGIDEEQAEKNAKRKLERQIRKDILRLFTDGFLLPGLWVLGGYWLSLLLGSDDDKDKAIDDMKSRIATAPIEGLAGGDVISNLASMAYTGEWNWNKLTKEMPLSSNLKQIGEKAFRSKDWSGAINDMINLSVQMGVGMNPQTLEDMIVGIEDCIEACGNDVTLAHEGMICAAYILNCPKSQIKLMYFNELGMSGEEASKLTPQQIAERYARMQVKLGRPLMVGAWDDEELIEKKKASANKTIKERTAKMGDADINEAYKQYEEVYKGVDKQVKAAKKMAETDYLRAAQMMASAQDSKNFTIYEEFKYMDGNLDRIAKLYLKSKSIEEANLCKETMLRYKSAMVEVLDARTEDERKEAMNSLSEVMQDFSKKYESLMAQ
jgi:hypothetical protein